MGIEGYYEDYFDERQEKEKLTNFQKIKNMSLDEMVRWLWRITNCESCEASKKECCFGAGKCEKTLKQWLQQESEV